VAQRKARRGPYLDFLELLHERVPAPDVFPFTLPAIRQLNVLPLHPQVTFFLGENGSGKSTLLEAIAVAYGLNPEGGSRGHSFATRRSHSPLGEWIRLAKQTTARDAYFLRAESFYNVASDIERLDREAEGFGLPLIDAYGGKSLHEQSHGESFFALFQNRLLGNGLYLLDEPEAALSPQRQLQFLSILHKYVLSGGQFIIATHSPILLAYPDACLYRFDAGGIRETAYTGTEHYRITRAFLNHPQAMLDELCPGIAQSEPEH
jgi:predicted ATPase